MPHSLKVASPDYRTRAVAFPVPNLPHLNGTRVPGQTGHGVFPHSTDLTKNQHYLYIKIPNGILTLLAPAMLLKDSFHM